MKDFEFILIAVLTFFFTTGCVSDLVEQEHTDQGHPVRLNESDVEPGILRIKLREDAENIVLASTRTGVETTDPRIREVVRMLGATAAEPVFRSGPRYESRHREEGLHLWYDITFDERIAVTRAYNSFADIDAVAVVEPVYKAKISSIPPQVTLSAPGYAAATATQPPFDDPLLDQQWHYHNDGSLPGSVAGCDINLFNAWKINTGHPDVIVAILDGGFISHNDLRANLWVNEAELNGVEGVDDDGNGYVDDIHGWNFNRDQAGITSFYHGAHVAGTVGAVNNNGVGVCGVAGGDGTGNGVRLMCCQVFSHGWEGTGELTGNIPQALVYAADNGAVVAQCSFGVSNTQSLRDAVNYFMKYAGVDENGNQSGPMRGGLIIAAAGNEGRDLPNYPAYYDGVVSVGAIGPDNNRTYYSNYGDWVDLAAPGGAIRDADEAGVLSCYPPQTYGFMQGTSMAAPHVSGVAGLVISEFGVGAVGFTNNNLRSILLSSCRPLGQSLGAGLIDAAAALSHGRGERPGKVEYVTAEWNIRSVTLRLKTPQDAYGDAVSEYRILIGKEPVSDLDPDRNHPGIHSYYVRNKSEAGEMEQVRITDLQYGYYYLSIFAVDKYGVASLPVYLQGQTLSSDSELFLKNEFSDLTFKQHGQSEEYALDNYFGATVEGDPITFTVSVSADNIVDAVIVESNILRIRSLADGRCTVTVTAANDEGYTISSDINVLVLARDQGIGIDPNVAGDILYIAVNLDYGGPASFWIRDMAGRSVMEWDDVVSSGTIIPIDISALSGGYYTLTTTMIGYSHKTNFVKL